MKRSHAMMQLWPWAGMIGAATAWILAHQIGSDGTFYNCRSGTALAVVVGILALILALGSGFGSYRLWRRTSETEGRRFVAILGAMFAILLALAILLSILAGLIMPECLT